MITDYTATKPNKKKQLVKCPACGKTGKLTRYVDGSANIVHSGHVELGFFSVDKSCHFKKGEYV